MWTVLNHLSGPALDVAAVIAVLGISARPVFRYPYMWRYLESRLQTQHRRASNKGKRMRDTRTSSMTMPVYSRQASPISARCKKGRNQSPRSKLSYAVLPICRKGSVGSAQSK